MKVKSKEMPQNNLQIKIEKFSKLSDQDCAFVIERYLLESLEMEDPTYIEWEVLTKFINIDYTLREDLCKLFNFSLKRNLQKIAGIPINAWLKQYLDKYARIPREPETFLRYATSNPEIQKLNEKDQIRLIRIFRLYDYLLVEPVPDLDSPQAVSLTRFPMRLSKSLKEILAEMSSAQMEAMPSSGTASEKLGVKEALHKFPKLGEQAVTAGAIKLKQFDQPVRPSVRNWLYDYTSQLGQTGHSSMDRTTYVFRSDNAKNLSSPEREKLAIILKSFDENSPLPIDGQRQEVVFESFLKKEAAPQKFFPAAPRLTASTNFVRHVERASAPAAPAQRPFSIEPQKKSPPVQKQENSFVRHYPKPEIKKAPEFNQVSTFPSSAKTRPFPSPTIRREISQGQTFENIPTKIDEDKIEYTNPYPKPGTHEMQTEGNGDNISNVRFSEGTPKNSFTPISQVSARPLNPVPSSPAKPVAYKYIPPNRNIIRPQSGSETRYGSPEPRIDGNIVDLKGDK
jgi:hypothetical protein